MARLAQTTVMCQTITNLMMSLQQAKVGIGGRQATPEIPIR